jgi:LysM repeat protein
VEHGQTVYRIAKNYGMDWHELMRVNRISNPSSLEVGQQLFIPRLAPPVFVPMRGGPLGYEDIRSLVGAPRTKSDWRTITVHHSGTRTGSAKLFHRDHMRRHMGGLFYHFVIGNGTNSPEGGLEVGFRWQRQIKANRPYDIQICLVGDFDEQDVSEAQFSTLVELIQVLRQDYGIGIENIRKHEDIKGKHTACPGRNFPFQRLLVELSRR